MKKILALVLALAMVLGCTSAMAAINVNVNADVTEKDKDGKDVIVNKNFDIAPENYKTYVDQDGKIKLSITGTANDSMKIKAEDDGTYNVYLERYVYDKNTNSYSWVPVKGADKQENEICDINYVMKDGKPVSYQEVVDEKGNKTYPNGNKFTVDWDVSADDLDGTVDNREQLIRVVVDYVDAKFPSEYQQFWVNKVYGGNSYYGADGKKVVDVDWIVTGRTWYVDNHAHAFQNLSQTFDGGYKNGWKGTYANIKLTEGTQKIKLVAAGAWNIGNIIVTVKGDEVTFDYLMHEDVKTTDIWDEITVDSEYLNIFADEDSIDFWADSAFEFGATYSIANDLGGDTEVALVAELIVDYTSNSPFVYREWTGMNP